MEEYYTIWVRSENRLSGDTNDFYYNIGGILPQDITYFKVQVLEYIIPYHGINTYDSQAFEIRADFGSSSIYHSDNIPETSLMISNLKDYLVYYNNVNGVDYLENKSEFNIKPGPEIIINRPRDIINIQLIATDNNQLLVTDEQVPSNPIDWYMLLKFTPLS